MRSRCSRTWPWTSSMSTSEYRSVDAESDLPIGASELAALATQLFAASVRPGPDSPPQTSLPAPRGGGGDTTAPATAASAAAGSANVFTPPVAPIPLTDVFIPAPNSPGPDGLPQAVPVAARGSVPDATAFSPFSVPTSGIVPTVPGVLAGTPPAVPLAPRGSAPTWPSGAPSIGDLGWT